MNFPDSARFLFRAALWATQVMHDPADAAQALAARVDHIVENQNGDLARCMRLLARLQIGLGQIDEAAVTMLRLLRAVPSGTNERHLWPRGFEPCTYHSCSLHTDV